MPYMEVAVQRRARGEGGVGWGGGVRGEEEGAAAAASTLAGA